MIERKDLKKVVVSTGHLKNAVVVAMAEALRQRSLLLQLKGKLATLSWSDRSYNTQTAEQQH